MTVLATLGGAGRPVHTEGDLLADEGGLLRKRGRVLYASDFENRGYDGWIPIFNANGNTKHPPLSLASFPTTGLRIAAEKGSSSSAIRRLSRLTREKTVVSMSATIAYFAEYPPGTPEASVAGYRPWRTMHIGFDTQGWDGARQWFALQIDRRSWDQMHVNLTARTHRDDGAWQWANVGTAVVPIGPNENKTNEDYLRLTVEMNGEVPRYVEAQLSGTTIDLTTFDWETLDIDEHPQYNSADLWTSFSGGFNPWFEVWSASEGEHSFAGVTVRDICVTTGDVLA